MESMVSNSNNTSNEVATLSNSGGSPSRVTSSGSLTPTATQRDNNLCKECRAPRFASDNTSDHIWLYCKDCLLRRNCTMKEHEREYKNAKKRGSDEVEQKWGKYIEAYSVIQKLRKRANAHDNNVNYVEYQVNNDKVNGIEFMDKHYRLTFFKNRYKPLTSIYDKQRNDERKAYRKSIISRDVPENHAHRNLRIYDDEVVNMACNENLPNYMYEVQFLVVNRTKSEKREKDDKTKKRKLDDEDFKRFRKSNPNDPITLEFNRNYNQQLNRWKTRAINAAAIISISVVLTYLSSSPSENQNVSNHAPNVDNMQRNLEEKDIGTWWPYAMFRFLVTLWSYAPCRFVVISFITIIIINFCQPLVTKLLQYVYKMFCPGKKKKFKNDKNVEDQADVQEKGEAHVVNTNKAPGYEEITDGGGKDNRDSNSGAILRPRFNKKKSAAYMKWEKKFDGKMEVDLRRNNFTDEDILAIGELLKTNNTLKELNLDDDNITDIQSIGDALKTNNTLETLYLFNNNITDVQSIGEGLKTNNTLTRLSLSGNNITNVQSIGEGLKSNNTLKTLTLSNNNITDDGGIQSIIDVLKTNNTLKTLFLYDNQLSDNMKSQLDVIEQYKKKGSFGYQQVEGMRIGT